MLCISTIFSSCLIGFVTLAFITFCIFHCFFPTFWWTKTWYYYCGDLAQMVQILGSAQGWKACRRAEMRKSHSQEMEHLLSSVKASFSIWPYVVPPALFLSPRGSRTGSWAFLAWFLPSWICCLFSYASTMSNVLPTLLQGNFISSELNATGRNEDSVSVRFTVKYLWFQTCGREGCPRIWTPLFLARTKQGPLKAAKRQQALV